MANPKRPRDANQLAIAYFQNRNWKKRGPYKKRISNWPTTRY